MASMVYQSSSLRSICLRLLGGAALLCPATCVAAELAPDQHAWYQARISNGNAALPATPPPAVPHQSAEAVIEWQALNAALSTQSFDRISTFLLANPGWPKEMEMRKAAEAALGRGGFIPATALPYFARFAPTDASAHLKHALALLAAGNGADANRAARMAWISGALTGDEELRLTSTFPAAIGAADHDLRMDRLLWSGATTAAARQMANISAARRSEFEARLAMRSRTPAAAIKMAEAEAADPTLVRTNAGYIADKVRWLSASGRGAEAQALLAGPRQLSTPPLDADAWLGLIVTQARAAARSGNHALAYDIARQVDDALPIGAAILDQPIGVRDDYTNALWLAATTARDKLGRQREAAGLFLLYAAGGRSPSVQARGQYWAGRSALDAGDSTLANDYFSRAARHFDQFHGQLAIERLGQPQPRPVDERQISFSQAERDVFTNNSLVRAARVLGEIGAWRDQTLFLRTIANNARTDADHYFSARLSQEIGRPDLAVMVGRSARVNGLDDYVPTAFPVVAVPSGLESRWTFIHAISRQESQFDRAIISHAGARGQMQLMPGTAREVAGQLGLPYDSAALTSDTSYNMTLGSHYFERMLTYYGGSYPLAVAAYNAGPGNVNRWLAANGDPRMGTIAMIDWIEAIPISETRTYVQKVLENAVVYETMRPDAPAEQRNTLSRLLGKSPPG